MWNKNKLYSELISEIPDFYEAEDPVDYVWATERYDVLSKTVNRYEKSGTYKINFFIGEEFAYGSTPDFVQVGVYLVFYRKYENSDWIVNGRGKVTERYNTYVVLDHAVPTTKGRNKFRTFTTWPMPGSHDYLNGLSESIVSAYTEYLTKEQRSVLPVVISGYIGQSKQGESLTNSPVLNANIDLVPTLINIDDENKHEPLPAEPYRLDWLWRLTEYWTFDDSSQTDMLIATWDAMGGMYQDIVLNYKIPINAVGGEVSWSIFEYYNPDNALVDDINILNVSGVNIFVDKADSAYIGHKLTSQGGIDSIILGIEPSPNPVIIISEAYNGFNNSDIGSVVPVTKQIIPGEWKNHRIPDQFLEVSYVYEDISEDLKNSYDGDLGAYPHLFNTVYEKFLDDLIKTSYIKQTKDSVGVSTSLDFSGAVTGVIGPFLLENK